MCWIGLGQSAIVDWTPIVLGKFVCVISSSSVRELHESLTQTMSVLSDNLT